MKKIISIILIMASLLSFAACSDSKYEPIKSSDEEARVMLTFKYEKEEYEVKYELYRALFLNLCNSYDGGDPSFWNTEAAISAKEQINADIIDYCSDIFATIHLSKKLGYDPYSKNADEQIEAYIATSVEGNNGDIEGFGGDYDAYLASLTKMNMNYSVQVLLLRYAIAYEKIVEHYAGTFNENNPSESDKGKLEYTESDVRSFYDSDECARVSLIEINSLYISKETAQQRRDKIASFDNEEQALNYAVQFTAGTPDDILNGVVIGPHSLDNAYYSAVTSAAAELELHETSEVIEVTTDNETSYWILYKREKTEEYFTECYEDVESVYVSESIGRIIDEVKRAIEETAEKSELWNSIDHSAIKMK